jgi:endoglucanase
MAVRKGKTDIELLRSICDAPGVAGFEDPIRAFLLPEFTKCCDEVRTDRMGNLIGLKRAKRPVAGEAPLKVMVSAHMDEIGFAVRHIDQGGFVRIMQLGGIDPRVVVSERVIIHGTEDVPGFIAPQPNWILSDEEKKRVTPVNELIVDTGLSKAELEKKVNLGDPISFAANFEDLNANMVLGRNFDDRIGVYTLVEAMRRVGDLGVDFYAVASVQEELGVRGAITAAYGIDPDIGIAIDGSLASDVPYAKEEDRHCELGQGAGIYLIDNRTVSDPLLVRFLIKLAGENDIRFQRNLGGGTDASEIQRTKSGARALTIGAPTRYMHSTTQLCHKDDIEETVRLLVAILENAHSGGLR